MKKALLFSLIFTVVLFGVSLFYTYWCGHWDGWNVTESKPSGGLIYCKGYPFPFIARYNDGAWFIGDGATVFGLIKNLAIYFALGMVVFFIFKVLFKRRTSK